MFYKVPVSLQNICKRDIINLSQKLLSLIRIKRISGNSLLKIPLFELIGKPT